MSRLLSPNLIVDSSQKLALALENGSTNVRLCSRLLSRLGRPFPEQAPLRKAPTESIVSMASIEQSDVADFMITAIQHCARAFDRASTSSVSLTSDVHRHLESKG